MLRPKYKGFFVGILLAMLNTMPAAAQNIVLTAKDGSLTVQGTLVAARENEFVVRTNIGVVKVDRSTVVCKGSACPVDLAAGSDMTIAAPAELAEIFIPLLAEGFAESVETEAIVLDAAGIPLNDGAALEDQVRNTRSGEDHSINIRLVDQQGEPASNLSVRAAGGTRVFEMLSSGQASLIFSESAADDKAVAATRSTGGGNIRDFNQERVVAVDGYVVVTHPRNAVRSMTIMQVSDVIAGNIDNWSALGGPDHPINVYSFNPTSEAFHHINDLILKPYGQNLTQAAKFIQSNRELTVAVKSDPYGVGIVNFASVRDTRPVAIENECGMIIRPTAFNIKTEEYALQNRITAYSRRDNDQIVSDFLEFIDGPTLDDLVAKSGLIGLSILNEDSNVVRDRLLAAVESSTPDISSSLLKQFVLDAMDTTRVSTTFRFARGASELDNKARRDLARVLRYIEDTKPSRIVLAGFADARGNFRKNLALSKSRAESVLEQLQNVDVGGRLNNLEIEIRGFGELGPVACNESFAGRATNRRVEIWVE